LEAKVIDQDIKRAAARLVARVMLAAAVAIGLAVFSVEQASAHAVIWDYSPKKTVGLEFSYDDGTPMAYSEIKVFGPDDLSKLSQMGRTDKNGSFAFIPETAGKWLVTSDDGNGHLAQAELAVGAPAEAAAGQGAEAGSPPLANPAKAAAAASKPWKIGLVVSALLNVGLVSARVNRKQAAKPAGA
jgi:nickel transport protein